MDKQHEQVHRVDTGGLAAESTLMAPRAMRDIGWAVKQMWHGQAVTRRGWNGRNMYLRLQIPDANSANTLPYVWMKTADGHRVPWLCSQTDLLSTDWEHFEGK